MLAEDDDVVVAVVTLEKSTDSMLGTEATWQRPVRDGGSVLECASRCCSVGKIGQSATSATSRTGWCEIGRLCKGDGDGDGDRA